MRLTKNGIKYTYDGDKLIREVRNTVLKSYAIDGGLKFGANQLLMMSGILLGKNVWRNRGLFMR